MKYKNNCFILPIKYLGWIVLTIITLNACSTVKLGDDRKMVSEGTNSPNNQRVINPISRQATPKVSIDKIAPKSTDKDLITLWSVQVLSVSSDNITGLNANKRRIEGMGYKAYRIESDRSKKLLVGPFKSPEAVKPVLRQLRANGYPDAFISSQEQAEVQMSPEDQKVITFSTKLDPAVDLTNGGVTIIHQGTTSDEPDTEMAVLINATHRIRNLDRPKIALFTPETTTGISTIFAPANPLVTVEDELQVWILNPSVFTHSSKGVVALQIVLRQLYKNNINDVPQVVFVAGPQSTPGTLLAELVHDLGIQVRNIDSQNRVLAEAHRSDGVIVPVLLGDIFIPDGQTRKGILTINQQKDRTENQNDTKTFRLIETKEQELLARLIGKAQGETKTTQILQRAPYLQGLILSVYDGKRGRDGKGNPRQDFYNELIKREFPLLFLVNPETRAASLMNWPDLGTALPVFADRASLERTASGLGIQKDDFAYAVMTPKELLAWAAEREYPLAFNAFRDSNQAPVYVFMTVEEVKLLLDI